MSISRRQFVLGAAGTAGGLLLARPGDVLASGLTAGPSPSVSRTSRLFPGSTLVHTDLHNHTLLSDGAGDADAAFATMRANGLDVAALTDHASVSYGLPASACGGNSACQGLAGINEASWAHAKELADAALADGSFVAIRGFEWSSPTLGHMNVWFSDNWIDPLHTGGVTSGNTLTNFAHTTPPPLDAYPAIEREIAAHSVTGAAMSGFYEWLTLPTSVRGGGDGIAGWNHPGREVDRFSSFAFNAALVPRIVSLEMFNKKDDYLFEGTDAGLPSPLVQCLDAGWRPGLLGSSDEHGTTWGGPNGKGRAGVWVDSFDRAGVKAALQDRRFFATRLKGLRVDASANGVRMGTTLVHQAGPVTFQVDIDRGPAWWGRRLTLQVLQTGSLLPTIVHEVEITVPRTDQPVVSVTVPVSADNGSWVVLRLADKAPDAADDLEAEPRAAGTPYAAGGLAIAYASPFYLSPTPAPLVPEVPVAAVLPVAAAAVAGAVLYHQHRHDHADAGDAHPH